MAESHILYPVHRSVHIGYPWPVSLLVPRNPRNVEKVYKKEFRDWDVIMVSLVPDRCCSAADVVSRP